ncbi:hypothetical protein HI914_06721 [Erysiphe necator]|nr:hypothetical protein HI914_06721 [Erysiphe necator]
MPCQKQTILSDLCFRKRWAIPIYRTLQVPAGFTCSVTVNGQVFTGLLSTTEIGAKEHAANTALHYISTAKK